MKSNVHNPHQDNAPKRLQPRRPIILTLMFWVFVLWAALGWVRFMQTLTQRALILEQVSLETYRYLLLAGLLWGTMAIPVLWGVISRASWTLKILWIPGVVYPLSYWIERLFLWQDPTGRGNWPFMLILTLVWSGLIIGSLRSARVRMFFETKI